MCNPKPLGRCSSHAKPEISKNYNVFAKATAARGAAKNGLLIAEASLKEAFAFRDNNPDDAYAEDDIQKASKKVDAAQAKLEKAHQKVVVANEEYKQSEIINDATLTGRKHLKSHPDYPEFPMRLRIAEKMNDWDKRVRNLKDSNGIKIVSKEGKFSPEAPAVFKELLLEAEAGKAAAEVNEKNAYAKERDLKLKLAQQDNELSALANKPDVHWDSWNAQSEKSKETMEAIKQAKSEALEFRMEQRMHAIHQKDLQEALIKAESS
jgi:hypothetical protein